MQIHVVQQGQSLYGIGQVYGIPYEEIAKANELTDPSRLAVGQALVIPITGSYHWVQSGQTLYTISHLYGTTVEELARINGISPNSVLYVGQRLYIPQRRKTIAEVFLYVEPREATLTSTVAEVRRRVRDLTYLAMFSYEAQRDGSLKAPPIDNMPEIAAQAGVLNAMVVTNLEEFKFSPELAHVLLTDQQVQNRLFENIVQTAKRLGFSDIHFDFEFIRPSDRELYNQFMRNARARFHAVGLTLSVALPPKMTDARSGMYGGIDFKSLGEIVDFVTLMTYEWGYSYSDPQAVSPINQVRRVVEFAVSQIPSGKIFLGQNLYGYDWTYPYPPKTGVAAKALSPQQAVNLAISRNAEIQYDTTAQAPFFLYWVDGVRHDVWFEDARSIQAKFNLIKEFNLRGIMYWKLGLAFPQNWLLLTDNFIIRKR
ncbi:glycosyl hydrolase family 18 protein [Sporosarcina thermotolerans]|uniref:Glycosyl hydrolase family 18 protein n=1 Tax=Sporosarcina thermotolerans TaxID=633404 RepID=A0AAW9A7S4_9BACL|nr:LysM peptidoglycan-binding domain-containing protein [Sporosarcina thermotolerans]MDW0117074.1 glycosyl hydrolase family 18 protein [Sporosarcina thermotolerans]WHT49970.1 glycosyl hydrolase family 18 protein [Sporosarcina thermotolerans]